MVKRLWAVPKHLSIDKRKTLDVQPDIQIFFTRHLIQKRKTKKNAKTCACAAKNLFGIQIKKTSLIMGHKKCDNCKKHHELYLNYNSENSFSL